MPCALLPSYMVSRSGVPSPSNPWTLQKVTEDEDEEEEKKKRKKKEKKGQA